MPLADKTAPPLHPKAPLRQPPVIRDVLPVRHAITVEKHEIIPGGLGDGLVENHRFAKPVIGMPDVPDGEGRLPRKTGNQFARGFPRTIVRDQHFVGRATLPRDPGENLGERVRTVVGADDQRDAGG